MEHRKRHLNQHKVELSTQTRIVMMKRKRATGKPAVGGKDIIASLASVAMKNAAKYDARLATKKATAEAC